MNQRKYSISDIKKAIAEVGTSISALAEKLNCSRSTVYAYRRKYPEIAAALAGDDAQPVVAQKQFPREKFVAAIAESKGILQKVADAVGCTRQTVYNALEEWTDLKTLLDDARTSLVDQAESTIVAMMNQRDDLKVTLNAATYITSRLGKKRGWTESTELTGPGGVGLFDVSPETLELAKKLGIEPSKVVQQFEQMVRLAAVQRGIVDG